MKTKPFPAEPTLCLPEDVAAVVTPSLIATDLPRRLAAPIIGVANATGSTVETAAALTVMHLATWCGERSGVYALDERWVPAACNQLHCFPDTTVMARAQSLLTDEFDRFETQLRPLITSTWTEKQRDERRMVARLDPSGKVRRRLDAMTQGWMTWVRNPDQASLRTATQNAYRGALTTLLDDASLFEGLLAPVAPDATRQLFETIQQAMVGGHVFPTRAQHQAEELLETPLPAPIKFSLIAHVDRGLGERLVKSQDPSISSWLQRCVAWAPEVDLATGRIPESPRSLWHDEWALVQEMTTQARLNASGTVYITPASASVFMAWEQEAREWRDRLSPAERAFLSWVPDLPYRLFVPLRVTAIYGDDSSAGFARLAVHLTRHVARNALALHQRCHPQVVTCKKTLFAARVQDLLDLGDACESELSPAEHSVYVAALRSVNRAPLPAPAAPLEAVDPLELDSTSTVSMAPQHAHQAAA